MTIHPSTSEISTNLKKNNFTSRLKIVIVTLMLLTPFSGITNFYNNGYLKKQAIYNNQNYVSLKSTKKDKLDKDGLRENCTPSETGVWAGYNLVSSSTKGNNIVMNITTLINASYEMANGTFGTNNFWATNLAEKNSLEVIFIWDEIPDFPESTDIDLSSDDKGSGTLEFKFSKPVTNPILHIDKLGEYSNGLPNIANSLELILLNENAHLTKLSGTADFEVTTNRIRRTPDILTTNES